MKKLLLIIAILASGCVPGLCAGNSYTLNQGICVFNTDLNGKIYDIDYLGVQYITDRTIGYIAEFEGIPADEVDFIFSTSIASIRPAESIFYQDGDSMAPAHGIIYYWPNSHIYSIMLIMEKCIAMTSLAHELIHLYLNEKDQKGNVDLNNRMNHPFNWYYYNDTGVNNPKSVECQINSSLLQDLCWIVNAKCK